MEAELKTCKEVYEQSLVKTIGSPEELQAIKYHHKMFLNPENLFVRNCQVRPHIVLYVCLEYRFFNKLQNLDLSGIDMVQDVLCLMLDSVLNFSSNIKTMNLSRNKAGKKLVEVIKLLLMSRGLQSLIMTFMEINTRLFNDICVGLAKNTSLKIADFSYNFIDETGVQSMLLTMQYNKNLESVDFRHNRLSVKGAEELKQVIEENGKINKHSVLL